MEIFTFQNHFKLRLTVLLIILFCSKGYCQFSNEFEDYKNLYPNASIVRLNQETIIKIELENNEIIINQEFYEEDLYLNELAKHGSKRSLSFSTFYELVEIEASSLVFLDGKYKDFKVKDFKKKNELDVSFYSDTESLNFIFPNLSKGSKSKLNYSEKVKNPRFLRAIYLGDYFPIINNKIIIQVDKNIDIKFQEFNTEELNVSFEKEIKKDKIIYTWKAEAIDEYELEDNSPTYKKILPHIIPVITAYQTDSESINLATNVKDLYKWYYGLVENLNREEASPQLIKLVDELIENKDNDYEKVKAIYYWTQSNIKYIAFEYALGGFIPRQANEVFTKKYGDCKDNSSILLQMLKLAGIKGNLTWIGTRSIPYSYSEIPTPLVDNHMILSFEFENDIFFLDATGRYVPLDFPTSFIQGKEALIGYGKDDFIVKKVPVVPAEYNSTFDTTNLYLVGQNLKGSSRTIISGYKKIEYFQFYENERSKDEIKEFLNLNLKKGNNKFLVKSYNETNKFEYDKKLIIDYEFDLNDYVKEIDDEIYINLNLNKEISLFKTKEDRKSDVEYEYKSLYNYTTILNIPDGYKIEFIPEDVHFSNEFVNSKIKYDIKENQIIYNHIVKLDFISLSKNEQEMVNSVIASTEKAFKEHVILKKI